MVRMKNLYKVNVIINIYTSLHHDNSMSSSEQLMKYVIQIEFNKYHNISYIMYHNI